MIPYIEKYNMTQNYLEIVKKTIIYSFIATHFNSMGSDEFLFYLTKIMSKKKTFNRLSAYLKDEIENKRHNTDRVLKNIGYFATLAKIGIDMKLDER